jgi:hypothetical protein
MITANKSKWNSFCLHDRDFDFNRDSLWWSQWSSSCPVTGHPTVNLCFFFPNNDLHLFRWHVSSFGCLIPFSNSNFVPKQILVVSLFFLNERWESLSQLIPIFSFTSALIVILIWDLLDFASSRKQKSPVLSRNVVLLFDVSCVGNSTHASKTVERETVV